MICYFTYTGVYAVSADNCLSIVKGPYNEDGQTHLKVEFPVVGIGSTISITCSVNNELNPSLLLIIVRKNHRRFDLHNPSQSDEPEFEYERESTHCNPTIPHADCYTFLITPKSIDMDGAVVMCGARNGPTIYNTAIGILHVQTTTQNEMQDLTETDKLNATTPTCTCTRKTCNITMGVLCGVVVVVVAICGLCLLIVLYCWKSKKGGDHQNEPPFEMDLPRYNRPP